MSGFFINTKKKQAMLALKHYIYFCTYYQKDSINVIKIEKHDENIIATFLTYGR